MKKQVIGIAILASFGLSACSDGLSEEEEIAQIEAGREATEEAEARADAPDPQPQGMSYDRAVECAATAVNVANVFDVIARQDAESNPQQAASARASAETNNAQAREFARLAERLGAETGAGKDRDAVLADIGVIDNQIRQRGSNTSDFMGFATQLARESDQCDREMAANN